MSQPQPPPQPQGQGYTLQDSQFSPRTTDAFEEIGEEYRRPLGDYSQQPLLQQDYGQLGHSQTQMRVQIQASETSLVPQRQPRRYKTTRRVVLTSGNLVLDCPVPPKYLQSVPQREEMEFTHMRYTAATCDPVDFVKEHYTLRPRLMGRTTEMFIVMTMYNEDEVLFARTMHGVMKNISHLCKRDRSRTWGANGWKKVVVCVVADGRSKIHPRTLNALASMGVYQDGIAKNVVNGKPVTAHIYEYTTQISIDPELKLRGAAEDIVPVQVVFCLKEKNQKKINSHRWFFQAFGAALEPNVCVLLDVGTRPGNTSIYHLWKAFDLNSNVAGACGEIRAMLGTGGRNLLNPLIATQNFEYKMSNILDKPLESVFGYISVLPGAFSAYRYIALQNDVNGQGPLQKYFLGETQHGGDADIFTANMYLAEDRILCFELVAKKDAAWVLHYVSSAFGETDVPDQVPEFISQRRRWLNGSFFAGVYALYHFAKIWGSDHSFIRKIMFMVEFLYMTFNLLFSWLAIGNFYLTFYILTRSLVSIPDPADMPFSTGTASLFHQVLNTIYGMLIAVQFIMAMGNRPQGSKWAYVLSMSFFAFLMVYMLFASGWLSYIGIRNAMREAFAAGEGVSVAITLASNGPFRDIILSYASTYVIYVVASFLFFDPWHIFTSMGAYLLMMPSYTNVLNIYAFCNTHDVSWGTKGDTTVATDLGTVSSKKDSSGAHTVEVTVPTEQKDLDAAYDEAVLDLQKHVVPQQKHRDAKTKQDDYYRAFRTRLVVSWILSNLILVVVITNSSILLALGDFTRRSSAYFAFILWSVAALAAFRFAGSCLFLVLRIFTG